jgi:hypothetical protein
VFEHGYSFGKKLWNGKQGDQLTRINALVNNPRLKRVGFLPMIL